MVAFVDKERGAAPNAAYRAPRVVCAIFKVWFNCWFRYCVIDALVMILGFEPGPLISAFAGAVAEGFSEGARVIVFTAAFPDERSERAWLEFQRVVNMMEVPRKLGVELELKEVPLDDIASAILEASKITAELRKKKVKVAITGGMRALGIAVFAAVLLTRWEREPEVEVHLEGRGTALKVPRATYTAENERDVVCVVPDLVSVKGYDLALLSLFRGKEGVDPRRHTLAGSPPAGFGDGGNGVACRGGVRPIRVEVRGGRKLSQHKRALPAPCWNSRLRQSPGVGTWRG